LLARDGRTQYADLVAALTTVIEELQERIGEGAGEEPGQS
jgi:hypothetical protein